MLVLVNIGSRDKSYQGLLVHEFSQRGIKGKVIAKELGMEELLMIARKIKADAIYCVNPSTLTHLVPGVKPSLEDWRGSVLQTSIPIVLGLPIYNIHHRKAGKAFFSIDVGKLHSAVYGEVFKYSYSIARTGVDIASAKRELLNVFCMTVDIETSLDNRITSIAFTEITNQAQIGKTWVISLLPRHYQDLVECELAWKVVRELLANESIKVFHNGTFDCFHLLRYHCIVNNYIWDTEYIWHSWYCELPKALAKIASFLLPDYYYWKHESESNPLEYNAKDTINTARLIIKMWELAPKWVWVNYAQLVNNIGPAIRISFEGMLTDRVVLAKSRDKAQADLSRGLDRLKEITGLEDFNPSSPQQVSALIYKVLKAKRPARAKSKSATGELELTKVARQHPLYSLFTSEIIKYRENRKAIGTYYDAYLTAGNRLLYSPKIDGTETLRQACSSSSLRYLPPGKNLVKSNVRNYGTQFQNIPYYHMQALMADPGFRLGEIDKSQSEARCTAYLAACEALREALENPPIIAGVKDFYCYTGFKFFGVEFDKDHPLRQAVKKIIHGTNYMMGALTFIDSVGLENLREYKQLLRYPGSIVSFAEHLLGLYHALYPEVSESWDTLVAEVAKTGRIVTPDGFTRLVFGDIVNDHSVKRSIVAHRSQHFSVVGINEALGTAFYKLQLPSKGAFRLKGQRHDSIIYQAKEEVFDMYTEKLLKIMDIPQQTDFGVMRIPLDAESGIYWKGDGT